MTAATSGFGTTFKRGDGGGPETFTTIAEVVGISGPSLKLETIDVTNMDSNGWREKIPTLKDAGEVQLDMNYLPANATQNYTQGLLADFNNRTLRNFKVVYSNPGATHVDLAWLREHIRPVRDRRRQAWSPCGHHLHWRTDLGLIS
jgi:hypothetical protein